VAEPQGDVVAGMVKLLSEQIAGFVFEFEPS
jgi:hypothetical protein